MKVQRPFVSVPVEAPDAAHRVAATAARVWGLPEPTPLRVSMNATFDCGEVVIRVGRPNAPAEVGLRLLDELAGCGVSVPVPMPLAPVRSDGLTAVALRRIEVLDIPVDWRAVGSMATRIHRIDPASLPDGYPIVDPRSLPWWDVAALLDEVASSTAFDDLVDARSARALAGAVGRCRGWAEQLDGGAAVVCHGDLHPGNVVMTSGGPVLLDWDLMAHAPALWDHVPLLAQLGPWGGDPEWYRCFAEGAGVDHSASDVAMRLAETRNLAATLMRIRSALVDVGARREVAVRLAYWRGEPAAPRWTAV